MPAESVLCPSSRPERARSTVFGIVGDDRGKPLVSFLSRPVQVTDELRQLDGEDQPARLTEFLRFASPCSASCAHFQEGACDLARKVAAHAPSATCTLPPCPIRDSCRWHQQEGEPACFRCPGIVTDGFEVRPPSAHELEDHLNVVPLTSW